MGGLLGRSASSIVSNLQNLALHKRVAGGKETR